MRLHARNYMTSLKTMWSVRNKLDIEKDGKI